MEKKPINVIPKITDRLGKYWAQPKLSDIVIDDTHALMTQESLNKLKEYSCSYPTGVYNGKMWKRKNLDTFTLCWYGEHDNPDLCSNNYREILIVEEAGQ